MNNIAYYSYEYECSDYIYAYYSKKTFIIYSEMI